MSSEQQVKVVVKYNYGSGIGDDTHAGANGFEVVDGHLVVSSDQRGEVAAYAPGKWYSVKVVWPAE